MNTAALWSLGWAFMIVELNSGAPFFFFSSDFCLAGGGRQEAGGGRWEPVAGGFS